MFKTGIQELRSFIEIRLQIVCFLKGNSEKFSHESYCDFLKLQKFSESQNGFKNIQIQRLLKKYCSFSKCSSFKIWRDSELKFVNFYPNLKMPIHDLKDGKEANYHLNKAHPSTNY